MSIPRKLQQDKSKDELVKESFTSETILNPGWDTEFFHLLSLLQTLAAENMKAFFSASLSAPQQIFICVL